MKPIGWSIPYDVVFKVGDRVLVPWTLGAKVPAVVIEDRGPLGKGRQQIVRVRFLTDQVYPYEESEYQWDFLERDDSPQEAPPPKDA